MTAIVVVGVSHMTAPVEVREKLAFVPDVLGDALARLRFVVDEGFILSTCNRVELYGVAGDAETASETLLRFLARDRGIALTGEEVYTHVGIHAVHHLFRVTAGLDSMVTGEHEILGQVRQAIALAEQHGALGSTTRRLGAAAVRTARRARTHGTAGRCPTSLVTLGLRAASDAGVPVGGSRVVVLGAGRVAESVLRRLARDNPASVTIAGRTSLHAESLAVRFGREIIPWTERAVAIANADLAIACTSAPEPVLHAGMLSSRADAPLVCLDLGVPRDVAPDVRAVSGVHVIGVDDLAPLAAAHQAERSSDARHAEAMLQVRAERFMATRVPVVV